MGQQQQLPSGGRRAHGSAALRAAIVVGLVVATVLAMGAVPAGAQVEPFCGIRWGSLPKSVEGLVPSPVTNVRAGQHPCYDRLVIDVSGTAPGYRVEYVDVVRRDGSGEPVALAGGAFLQITAFAPAVDLVGPTPVATYAPPDPSHAVSVAGFATFRQVAYTGTFEGHTRLGLGVRARLPFRVFVLAGPGDGSRVVIDVAHRWS